MAEYGTKRIGFAIKVSAVTEVRTAPSRHQLVNRFDEHGDLFTLDRLPSEDNLAFKKRIMDMTYHPGGPHYEGFLNNLSRELACPRQLALTIDLKNGSDGKALARNPRVDILADRIILYHNWLDYDNFEVDKEINIYDLGAEGYYLNDLVNEINSSEYFFAALDDDIRPNLHSVNLVRGNTHKVIVDDVIRADDFTILSMQNIVEGTIWFSDTDAFATEVEGEPEEDGEYHVDYEYGRVLVHKLTDGSVTCGYTYATFPYEVDASLVHIYTLQDANYTKKLFHREYLQSGEDIDALPNTEGAEVFHQLFKETEVFWGE